MSFPTSYDPNHPDEAPLALPSAPRVPLHPSAPYIELQPPLSRRGHGPGVLVFLAPHPPDGTRKAETLDPEPVMKWAEEGYAVVGVRTESHSREEVDKAFEVGIKALMDCNECTKKDKLAVMGEFQICHSLHMLDYSIIRRY